VTQLSAEQAGLLAGANYGVVTTLRPDGSPHSTVVWVDVDDGVPVFNTAKGRVKEQNLEQNARLALLVVEGGDFYRWLSIDGRAELTDAGAEEKIDALSRKYDGKPWEYVAGQERVTVRILPDRVVTYGF
jgi:PPOX class probable F420-dependent enzyme